MLKSLMVERVRTQKTSSARTAGSVWFFGNLCRRMEARFQSTSSLRPMCNCCQWAIIISVGFSFLLAGCSSVPQDHASSLETGDIPLEVEQPIADSSTATTQGQMLPISAEATIHGETILLEIARTPVQQAIGLMYRSDLPDNRGMLFPFDPPRPVNFWMRNVEFPLDMIFLRNGEVRAIAPNVPPCMTPTCPTYGPDGDIDQVIELNGGRAEALGLSVGDTIEIRYLEENEVMSRIIPTPHT